MPLTPFTATSSPGEVYSDAVTGDLWEAIGWITSPATILKNARTGQTHVEIIGCVNAMRFTRLIPEGDASA